MIKSSQINRAISSRDTKNFIEKANQRSRRSSFVQNLIADYKNASSQKSQKQSNHSRINSIQNHNHTISGKIKFKPLAQQDQKYHIRERQNIPQQVKQFCSRKRSSKMDINQNQVHQVHFPLKDKNFLDKYRSTQLMKEQQVQSCCSKRGSHTKKKSSNPMNQNLESNYESQFLKTMLFATDKLDNKMTQGIKSYEKKRPATGIQYGFGESISHPPQGANIKFMDKDIKSTEVRFERECGKVIEFILQEKYQQGLNELLKIRNKLKQLGEKYLSFRSKNRQTSSIISILQQRQIKTLFLYGMVLMDLRQTNREKEVGRILEKIHNKIQSLSSYFEQQEHHQLLIFTLILKFNKGLAQLEQFLLTPDRLKRQQSIQTVNKLLDQYERIKANQQLSGLKESLDFIMLMLNQLPQSQSNFEVIFETVLLQLKSNLLRLLRENYGSSIQQISTHSKFKNQIKSSKILQNILLQNTIFKTINTVFNGLHNKIKRLLPENDHTNQIIKDFFEKNQVEQSKFQKDRLQQSQKHIGFYSKVIKNYQHLIEQVIILKCFSAHHIPEEQKQSGDGVKLGKQAQLFEVRKELIGLRDYQKVSHQLKTGQDTLSQSKTNSLIFSVILTFPRLFIYYYQLLDSYTSNHESLQFQQEMPAKYLFQKLSTLESVRTSIDQYIAKAFSTQDTGNTGDQEVNFVEIEFPSPQQSKNLLTGKIYEPSLLQVSSLSSWINLELIKVYFKIGQLSTASNMIIQNTQLIYDHLLENTPSLAPNHSKGNLTRQKVVNAEYKFLSWNKSLKDYMAKNQVLLIYIFWRTLSFTSELNLSTKVLTCSLSSQIFLHLFYLKLNCFSFGLYCNQKSLLEVFGHIFEKSITLKNCGKELRQKIVVEVKRLVQIYTSLEIVEKLSQSGQIDELNTPIDTFGDEAEEMQEVQFNEVEQQNFADGDSSIGNINAGQSRKSSRYWQQTIYRCDSNNQQQQITKRLKEVVEKIKKPYEYHLNYLKSQVNKPQTLKSLQGSEMPQIMETFSPILSDMKGQLDILLQLH